MKRIATVLSTALLALTALSAAFAADASAAEARARSVKGDAARTGGQGWLGIYIEVPGPLTRSALGLGEDEGLMITGTVKGGAAEKAGLKRGDVLLKVDGAGVSSDAEIREQLRGKAGQNVKIDLLRAGKPLSISATPGDRSEYRTPDAGEEGDEEDRGDINIRVPDIHVEIPDAPDEGDAPEAPDAPDMRELTVLVGGGAYLGVEPQNLGRELADAFGVPDGKGVLLARVLPNSPASKSGLKSGDVLVKFDGKPLEAASDLRRELRAIRGSRTVQLDAVRKGDALKFKVELSGGHGRNASRIRIPDLGRMRWNFGEGDRDRLQAELRDLREELKELRTQIRSLLDKERK
ncbi:MAG: PDZ domain-containing protein [Candidatus Eisenbacteria bacterium]|nr:PDZ domain-containing protein [Candidatus Eisenbacteria bacterium]